MLEFIKINKITEEDFDGIIKKSGGKRYSPDHSKETELNVDYEFTDAIVELKLIEEEGFEKKERQIKLSELFLKYNKDPVIILDTSVLSIEDKRKYYNIIEGPIKNNVKTASKQLKSTSEKKNNNVDRILIIFNNGYSALNIEDFKKVVEKCVKNDTTNIDYVICCGIYYYSDRFDSYTIAPFELISIRQNNEPVIYKEIQRAWNNFVDEFMKKFIVSEDISDNSKLPVLDIEFDIGGRTFIKPSPSFSSKSKFWLNGRPRQNSTKIDSDLSIAITFPKLNRAIWELLKQRLIDSWKLKNTYEEWVQYMLYNEKEYSTILKPFVPVMLNIEDIRHLLDANKIYNFSDLCQYAADKFNENYKRIVNSTQNVNEISIVLSKYIYVIIKEIGIDQKNDLSSIYIVENINDVERTKILVENERIFHEYALTLASAYAVKNDVDFILFHIDKKYSWDISK